LAKRLFLLAGARPNFMKVAPLFKAISEDSAFDPTLVHTGQHYDHSMSGAFLRDLGIPDPKHFLHVGSGTHAIQTAEVMRRLEPILVDESPAALIVVGDVNSTMAGALVAAKLSIPVIHVEAGLRSFDRSMPEEINRVVTDSISDLLLVTEDSGRKNLLNEGKSESAIALVGNLMVDSLKTNLANALQSDVFQRLKLKHIRYGLVTLHRPSNVDDESRLVEITSALSIIAEELPLYWTVHPRTRSQLSKYESSLYSNIELLEPLSYFDFLHLEAHAHAILTDSGGVQEESTVLGVPCFTLRDNTERPATIECGTNTLAGTKKESILSTWQNRKTFPKPSAVPPLWDGNAGIRSREAIKKFLMET
jgi:UDP-N-acetylglucosamine 2-epimerase (non-hydrolysing)